MSTSSLASRRPGAVKTPSASAAVSARPRQDLRQGMKGQKARHGGNFGKLHFQGGQTPIQRRLPKRGFTCRSRS
jgi:hypothetical protein